MTKIRTTTTTTTTTIIVVVGSNGTMIYILKWIFDGNSPVQRRKLRIVCGNHDALFNLPLPDNIIFKTNDSSISLAAADFFPLKIASFARSAPDKSMSHYLKTYDSSVWWLKERRKAKRNLILHGRSKRRSTACFSRLALIFSFKTEELEWSMTSFSQQHSNSLASILKEEPCCWIFECYRLKMKAASRLVHRLTRLIVL